MAPTLSQEVLNLTEELLEERSRTDAVLTAFKALRNELLVHAKELYESTPDDGDSGYNPGDSLTNAAAKVNEVLERFKTNQPLPKPAPQVVYSLEELEELERKHPNARLMTVASEEAGLWTIETIKMFVEQNHGNAFPSVVASNGEQIPAAVKTLEAAKWPTDTPK